MAGTKAGGKQAAQTNKLRHGEDFYNVIGAKGGARGRTGGFAAKIPCSCSVLAWKHLVRECAGVKGGRKSRRNGRVYADTK